MVEVPAGWVFQDEWFHEDCSVLQGPGNGDTKGVQHDASKAELTCNDCGTQVALGAVPTS